MAKRKRLNEIEKRIKEGRGTGEGSEYKPWIKIQDVPPKGRATRLKGIKTKRQHEFLSDMERNYFYFLEYSSDVIDIREQYPLLPIGDTISIAEELGVEHPKNPKTGEFIVLTTDFLVTTYINSKAKSIARTIKSKDDLVNKRVIEKFEIERVYWRKKEIDWGIVTEFEIDKVVANNIAFIHGYRDLRSIDSFNELTLAEIQDLVYEFIKRVIDENRSVREICTEFDDDMMLEIGTGISIFKYLLINKIIEIDLKSKININKPIKIKRVNEDIEGKVKVV